MEKYPTEVNVLLKNDDLLAKKEQQKQNEKLTYP